MTFHWPQVAYIVYLTITLLASGLRHYLEGKPWIFVGVLVEHAAVIALLIVGGFFG